MIEPIIANYILQFQKISEIYSTFDKKTDFLDEIYYYNTKTSYSDEEIIGVEQKCIDEWKKVLLKLCDYLINKIEVNKKYINILKIELKQVKKIYINIKNEPKKIDEYEEIYDDTLDKLRDIIEVTIYKDENANKRFKINWFLAIVGGFITGYILFKLGFA
ncbi:MAG: hypothetical protein KAT05_02480 [Spirochaetes bacterium]|nr:hypothetical protein [Spirochaetota bacterium]